MIQICKVKYTGKSSFIDLQLIGVPTGDGNFLQKLSKKIDRGVSRVYSGETGLNISSIYISLTEKTLYDQIVEFAGEHYQIVFLPDKEIRR